MKRVTITAAGLAAGLLLAMPNAAAAACPPDAVQVGHLCVDRYEASAWKIPDTLANKDNLIAAIQAGMITSAPQMAGAVRRGESSDDYSTCPDNGGGACTKVYAVSIAGVVPSRHLTWFQAAAACTSSGKRLLTNYEWTVAALGSPDPTGSDNGLTDCNTNNTNTVSNTGSRSACVSSRGAFDMVGNLKEWVADWVPLSTACPGWAGESNDDNCFAGASPVGYNAALVRGGSFSSHGSAGPLSVTAAIQPFVPLFSIGFRCAREL